MIPFEALAESGLVQPGSLLNWEYRLRLPPGASDVATIDAIKSRFPDAGWRVRGLADAGGGIRFWLDRLTQFIGLIGLASLLVGGVGVGNAISSFLAARLRTIATMKCLGAPERLVFSTYFLQLTALAVLGVVIGARDRRRAAVRGPVADRRAAAGARARRDLCRAARHRRGLRPAGVADVRAGAADARAPRAGGDPDARRRGGRGRAAAVARRAADRRRRRGAGGLHHLHRRQPRIAGWFVLGAVAPSSPSRCWRGC